MNPLTEIRKLIRRPVRRSRIVRLTHAMYGRDTEESFKILRAADRTRDINRGKKRKNGEARIRHERDMYVIMSQYLGVRDPILAVAIFDHDLFEENRRQWPLYRIEAEDGKEVRKIVWAVSKPPMSDRVLVSAEGSRRVDERVRKGERSAMLLKADDRLHYFLKPFPNQDRRKMVWKVAQTMQYIQQMALEVGLLAVELELAVAECIRINKITNQELSEFV